MAYPTILDNISKWGAFFNVLFMLFAIFLYNYNRSKFYEKNPTWDKFRKVTNKKLQLSEEN
jgi:hypothetical protein